MITKYNKLLSPHKLRKKIKLDKLCRKVKIANDETVKNIIDGQDKRFLIVCGPCSADNTDAVLDFCEKLKALHIKIKDKIFLMPRVYTAKARSTGDGYLGMMFQPDGDVIDIKRGVSAARRMLASCIAKTGLPLAEELLYGEQVSYNSDLISYYFLGARQSDSPYFRNIASALDVAVGVKNDLSGDLTCLAGSIHAVTTPKTFIYNGLEITTSGNRYSHGVLRGSIDAEGRFYRNCEQKDVDKLREECAALNIDNDFVMVDCSHANSGKCAVNQIRNAINAVKNTDVRGIMLESYIHGGTAQNEYGVSKTDECLDWDSTEKLIYELYDLLPAVNQ